MRNSNLPSPLALVREFSLGTVAVACAAHFVVAVHSEPEDAMAEQKSGYRNRLLRALSGHESRSLRKHLEPFDAALGINLIRGDEPEEWAYFPEEAVVSIIRTMQNGSMIEVGIIGCDGVVGIHSIGRNARQPYTGLVQQPGRCWRTSMHVLRDHFRTNGEFQEILLEYSTSFLIQVSQTAACNRLHPLEQRLARWLLMVRDRTRTDTLTLTQEFLSHMLGVRIAGVNEAVKTLTLSGLIGHGRGRVELLDRAGLRNAACECYLEPH